MTESVGSRYVPAAGRRWLTAAYDPVMALTMRETVWRSALVARIASQSSIHRVVDVGCGTGTFLTTLGVASTGLQLVGVDGDPRTLESATRKLDAGDTSVVLMEGLADELPLSDDSCDAVTMSLLLHHLDAQTKRLALKEAARVLRPGGKLFVVDWGRPTGGAFRALFLLVRVLDGFNVTRENALGLIPSMISESGFDEPRRFGRWRTGWGVLDGFEAALPREL